MIEPHRLFSVLYACLIGAAALTAVSADAPTAAVSGAHVSVLSAEQVVKILDDTIDWYRTLGTQQQNASEPSDVLILYANQQTADQVVALALDMARANAELLSSEANAVQPNQASSSQSLVRQISELDAQRASIQGQMSAAPKLRGSVHAAPINSARALELQGELAMVDARKNLLETMTEFVAQSSPQQAQANALKTHIDAAAAALPNVGADSATIPVGTAAALGRSPTSAATSAPSRAGIWDLGVTVLNLRNKMKTIEAIDQKTQALANTLLQISSLPVAQLKAYSARSDVLALQARGATGPGLLGLRSEFDTLAWLFKQTSAILLPLSKQQALLKQYRHNLSSWQDSIRKQYYEALEALGVRLGILAGILITVFLLSEVWRRAVLRFSHEPPRRYQLLLIRKIVMWTAILVIVGLSFATELSTFATFAGLLTAGVAVAMQSVLVSVVGYFFLIGKYGIRVGDRIQIGAVVGEVIDIGLVRMHLMELNPDGLLGPTGRIVAFANLVVFQASGGLFRHIPGVNLSWHETKLELPAVDDYVALKAELLSAVRTALGEEYRSEIDRQTKEIERSTETVAATETGPQLQMNLVDGHMVALIRYPVHFQQEAEIDERVSQALLKVIAKR